MSEVLNLLWVLLFGTLQLAGTIVVVLLVVKFYKKKKNEAKKRQRCLVWLMQNRPDLYAAVKDQPNKYLLAEELCKQLGVNP